MGRYALTTSQAPNGKPQVEFYDLLGSAGGYRWQAIPDVDGSIIDAPSGMAFSPDGKKLAAVFARGGAAFIICWKVPDGKLTGQYEVPVPAAQNSQSARGLDWVHNGSAWLTLGAALVDANNGRFLAQLNAPPVTNPWATGSDIVAFT